MNRAVGTDHTSTDVVLAFHLLPPHRRRRFLTMFTKGQRVVCINDTFDAITRIAFQNLPVKGKSYTIRALYVGRGKLLPNSPGETDGEIGVLLEEIRNQDHEARFSKHGFEPGFSSERFAPLHAEAKSEELVEHEPATA